MEKERYGCLLAPSQQSIEFNDTVQKISSTKAKIADRLEKLEYAIRLSRRSGRIVKQNIIFALSFISILLIANFTGNMTLPLGMLGHEGSTVLVILNGLRLLKD